MLEIFGMISFAIMSVILFAVSIVEASGKYRTLKELEKQAKKEVGANYKNDLPQYKLVDKIPEIEERERGVRYFNDKDMMKRTKYVDLVRLLHGERTTITDTPVHKEYIPGNVKKILDSIKNSTLEENPDVLNEALKEYAKYFHDKGLSKEDALDAAGEQIKRRVDKLAHQGGTYNEDEVVISTYDHSINDEDVLPHEDTHAGFHKSIQRHAKSGTWSHHVPVKDLAEENDLDDWDALEARMKYIDSLGDIDKIRNSRDSDKKLKAFLKKSDVVAANEGLAYAVSKFYSGRHKVDFGRYKNMTDPKLIEKSRDLCYELMSITGPEPAKKVVMDVMNEAYDKDADAVELLEHRVRDYVDGSMDMFRKITENPKEHLNKGKKKD